jgi:hypothetical protein
MGGRALCFLGRKFGPVTLLIFTVDDGDTPPPPFIIEPPSRAAAATRGATNLISGLRATFLGGAVVVGSAGAE